MKPLLKPKPYELLYTPVVRDCGPDNRVRPIGFVQALQEAARLHAEQLGYGIDTLRQEDSYWVLIRMELRWEKRPAYNETFAVQTWPKGSDKRYALRDFNISLDGVAIGQGRSAWLLLGTDGKPKALTGNWEHWKETLGEAWEGAPEKWNWPAEEPIIEGPSWVVGYSDLDINGHVNSARYWDWVTDAAYAAGFDPESIGQAGAQYLLELRTGWEISSSVIVRKDECFVALMQEGKPAFLVRFKRA